MMASGDGLGPGYGTTAAAMALAGHTVTAIELSDAADAATRFADLAGPGSVRFLKDDFYQVRLAADPSQRISQRIRCYTPADLALLLTGTGLALSTIVIGDRSYPPATPQPGLTELLIDRADYLAVLHPDPSQRLPDNPRSG